MCMSSLWQARRSLSRIRALTALVALIAALHAVPAGAAQAGPTPHALPPTVSTLPPAEVQKVLSGVPLEDLSAVQLSELLSQLPGLSTLSAEKLQEALTVAIEELAAKQGTLAQLSDPTELISKLEGPLGEALSLTELLSLLEGGETLTTLLTSGLGTPEATQLLGSLLSSSEEPKQLIEQALAGVNAEQLDALLGTTLTGEPVGVGTVEELAGQLGTTDEGLAEALGTSTSNLPPKALALTAPLANGKTLGMLNGVEGLTLGLLGTAHEEKEGGGGAGGSGESSGGSGGAGGTPGGTTIVVNTMAPQSTQTATSATQAAQAKIRIVGWRVRHHVVTLLVRVPSAGTLAVAGRGLRSRHVQASRPELVKLRAPLTAGGAASLRRHHGRMRIDVRVSFAQIGGPRSSMSTTVVFG